MGFLSSAVGASKRPRGSSVGEEILEDTEPDDTSILYASSSCYPPSILSRPSPLQLDPASIMFLVDTKTEIPHADFRDEDEGSIISSLISQLRSVTSFAIQFPPSRSFNDRVFCRVGMDLSRVTFPTFVLEPRSMLERITDFMAHPDLIFG